jgi:hypothetical protein
MARVNRMVYALPIIASALLPLSAGAVPSPSPGVAQTLAAPPSGYAAVHTGTLDGRFDAHALAGTYSAGAAEAENTANHDGFVDGYAMTWLQQSPRHYLIEYVVAFEGGKGATSWLSYDEASAKSDPKFQHSDSIPGIDTYYGAHLTDPIYGVVSDAFSFVKGNDVYGVAFISTADDVLNLAITQTKSQYSSAPSETIPPAQWPENAIAGPSSTALEAIGGFAGQAITVALIFGVVIVVVGLTVRWRHTAAAPAVWTGAPVPPPTAGAPLPVLSAGAAVQLSPDGNMWWDGQVWKESSIEAPPFAQRSSDGGSWWDGWNWRAVP